MAAADPTYPLYAIACIIASVMLLLVLLISFVRKSWNLGVAFLCFWLFWENLTLGINAIIWSNNADIRLYVYCDIVTHMQVITSVVKPIATLIIARRLYLITSLQSVEFPSKAAKRRDIFVEWILGLVIPLLVAGPLYYVVQELRFEVEEGIGCNDSADYSILSTLLLQPWVVLPPLISIAIYYPHVARAFYYHSREINHFLRSNDSVSRTNYFRILALASIDIVLTLPVGIATIILGVESSLSQGRILFYFGWTYDHTDWEPESFSYAELMSEGTAVTAQIYFQLWTSPILAFVIFGLFGVTSEARTLYWCIICRVGGLFGWRPTTRTRRARSSLGDIEFGERPVQNSMSLGLDSRPSFINPNACSQEDRGVGSGGAISEVESGSEKDDVEEVYPVADNGLGHEERSSQPSGSCQACVDNPSSMV